MQSHDIALYAGGPLGPDQISTNAADIKGSGFTTVILWSFHIAADGDIAFNDTQGIVSGGRYLGDAGWPQAVAALKSDGSTVERVWISVGASGAQDFTHIGALIAKQGTGPGSVLRKNFQALRDAFTVDGACVIDGIDFDNEDNLDASVMVAFATLLFELGFEVSFSPYNAPSIWVDTLSQLWQAGHRITRFNLQAYAGGFGNDPQQWIDLVAPVVGAQAAPGLIAPGLWCYHGAEGEDSRCPDAIARKFAAWSHQNTGLMAGFLWLYDDVLRYVADNPCEQGASTRDYAAAIKRGLTGTTQAAGDVAAPLAPPIRHVVMVMLENRGFDSVHGYLYTRASPPARIIPSGGPGFMGLDGATLPTQFAVRGDRVISGTPQPGVLGANSPGKDPGEPYRHVNQQLFNAPDAPPKGKAPTMNGFLQDYCDVIGADASDEQCKQILRMFTPQDLPALNALARTYAVSDAWFCSVPTQTNANRAFSLCGTSLGEVDNGYYPAGVRGWVFEADAFDTQTIWNVLDEHKVSWGIYYNEPYPPIPPYEAPYTWIAFPQVQKTRDAWSHFHKIDQFFTDARAGRLPAFTYIEPKWGGETKVSYVDGNDYHPPVDITHSELMLQEIYEALRANDAAWQETVLVVVFDEHGGTYDHVAPPWGARPPWGSDPNPHLPKPREHGFNFDRFGVRVPCIIASPWIAEKTVVRSNTGVPFDHTSILASILTLFGIDRRTVLGERVAAAPTFWHALTLPSPRKDDRAFPPVHGPSPGTALSFGQPFRLRHRSGQYIASVDAGVLHFYPTVGTAAVDLSFRGGYGGVTSSASVQLRTGELRVNGPGRMDKPANTLGAWRDDHWCYYHHSDASSLYLQQQWQVDRVGANPGTPLRFGDEVRLSSLYPSYLGQVLTISGNFLTTAPGATDTWFITPLP
jgi:phospholipase C